MAEMHPIQMFFSNHHPLSKFVQADFEGSVGNIVKVVIFAPDAFIHHQEDQSLHSGFATVVLDSIMGGAVMGSLEKLQPIATVGLSVNHLRKPKGGEKLSGSAVCTGIHNQLAYVTGELFGANNEPLAIASGTFMIGTRATSIREKQLTPMPDMNTGSRI